ncbi:MAG: TadE family protein [Bryobacteraceae bacterium]
MTMQNRRMRKRGLRTGAALVEMALVVTLMLLTFFGAVDFGRVFMNAVTVFNAAGVGAAYGAHDNIAAGNFAEIKKRAKDDANDLTDVTATAEQQCGCPDGTVIACSSLLIIPCPGYGVPRAYVRVRVQKQFDALAPFPGVPSTMNMGPYAWMRVR